LRPRVKYVRGFRRSFAEAAKPMSDFQKTPRRSVSAGGPVSGRDDARGREAPSDILIIEFVGRSSRVHRSLAGSEYRQTL
jgi:hypothetical protein